MEQWARVCVCCESWRRVQECVYRWLRLDESLPRGTMLLFSLGHKMQHVNRQMGALTALWMPIRLRINRLSITAVCACVHVWESEGKRRQIQWIIFFPKPMFAYSLESRQHDKHHLQKAGSKELRFSVLRRSGQHMHILWWSVGVTSALPVNWTCLSGPQCSVYVGRRSQSRFQRDSEGNVKAFESLGGRVVKLASVQVWWVCGNSVRLLKIAVGVKRRILVGSRSKKKKKKKDKSWRKSLSDTVKAEEIRL